jgi:hypothetical protein
MTSEAHTGSLRGQSQVDRQLRAYAARSAQEWILVPRVSPYAARSAQEWILVPRVSPLGDRYPERGFLCRGPTIGDLAGSAGRDGPLAGSPSVRDRPSKLPKPCTQAPLQAGSVPIGHRMRPQTAPSGAPQGSVRDGFDLCCVLAQAC